MENYRHTADAIVVGGGSVGLHTAHELHRRMGKDTKILAVTQENEWGGIASRSLEQFRMFNDSYALAEIVSRGIRLYDELEQDLGERTPGTHAYEKFPYIFTVGGERPDELSEILPSNAAPRPTLEQYREIRDNTEAWGFDTQSEELDSDELHERFEILDGDGITGAMVVNNAGHMHFDVMKGWLLDSSRADVSGRGVTYRSRTRAEKIILGHDGVAIGVELNGEKVYSDKIILALGAFALHLPALLPGEESERIAGNFTVTQRELFFAHTPSLRTRDSFFIVSPDGAIVRLSRREGHASYGYSASDDLEISQPIADPRPDNRQSAEFGIGHKELFVSRVYAMLGEVSLKWANTGKDSFALEPFGHSAGYYSAYADDLPVVGEIGDTGVILVAGAHHSGIMGGQGIAELAVGHALGNHTLSQRTIRETSIKRTPVKHTGLVL